jgi:Na+-translocating ferredoxin:NAD+ oxidoreductase RnfC subunit
MKMKYRAPFLTFTLTTLLFILVGLTAATPGREAVLKSAVQENTPYMINPAIDIDGYLNISEEAALYRASHLLSEAEFIEMSQEPGTIILDARSSERYNELHIKGAINLSFPDIAIESLKKTIPDLNTRILIYCNNNFQGAAGPFPSKMATASLNISTYIALYDYGYRNVYELGPLLNVQTSNLEFEGSWLNEQP